MYKRKTYPRGHVSGMVTAPFKQPRRTGQQTVTRVAIPRMITGYRPIPATFRTKKGEVKALDIPNAHYTMFSASAANTQTFLLSLVQEGTGFFNRIGRKIEMRSLHIRGGIFPNGTAQAVGDYVKWAIVYDRQPTGVLPIFSDIFKAYDGAGAATSSQFSDVNLDNRERFAVLRHKSFELPATAALQLASVSQTVVLEGEHQNITEFIKLGGLTTHYNGTANPITIANITTGALYLVTQGAFATGTEGWYIGLQFRLRYDDV